MTKEWKLDIWIWYRSMSVFCGIVQKFILPISRSRALLIAAFTITCFLWHDYEVYAFITKYLSTEAICSKNSSRSLILEELQLEKPDGFGMLPEFFRNSFGVLLELRPVKITNTRKKRYRCPFASRCLWYFITLSSIF